MNYIQKNLSCSLRYPDTFVKKGGIWLFAGRRLYADWLQEWRR
jgi:hypothetical protein